MNDLLKMKNIMGFLFMKIRKLRENEGEISQVACEGEIEGK